jgi:hypothetical protein
MVRIGDATDPRLVDQELAVQNLITSGRSSSAIPVGRNPATRRQRQRGLDNTELGDDGADSSWCALDALRT